MLKDVFDKAEVFVDGLSATVTEVTADVAACAAAIAGEIQNYFLALASGRMFACTPDEKGRCDTLHAKLCECEARIPKAAVVSLSGTRLMNIITLVKQIVEYFKKS